jgi:hypothetical protein
MASNYDLNLCVFITTRGHYGRKDIYKTSVPNLFSKIEKSFFKDRIVHIKRFDGDDDVYREMFQFFFAMGFYIIESKYESSGKELAVYHNEYQKDIVKMFENERVQSNEFSLWFEDDWIIKYKERSLDSYLTHGCSSLRKNKDLLSVRINCEAPESPDKTVRYDEYLLLQNVNYTQWGPTFTFQPTIIRSRDAMLAYRIIQENQQSIGHLHIELQSGLGFKRLSRSNTPFAFYDMDKLRCFHIGSSPFEQTLDNEGKLVCQ